MSRHTWPTNSLAAIADKLPFIISADAYYKSIIERRLRHFQGLDGHRDAHARAFSSRDDDDDDFAMPSGRVSRRADRLMRPRRRAAASKYARCNAIAARSSEYSQEEQARKKMARRIASFTCSTKLQYLRRLRLGAASRELEVSPITYYLRRALASAQPPCRRRSPAEMASHARIAT